MPAPLTSSAFGSIRPTDAHVIIDSLRHISPGPYIALVIAVSVACQWIAWRMRLPSILLLLVVGFGIGQVVRAEDVLGHDLLFDGVGLLVGVILFESSLGLRFKQARGLGKPVRRLITVTVLVAWILITVTAWALGFDKRVALLIGAILVVTGPTVINPILRSLRPTRRVASLLRWEGIVVDPIGAVLALLVFQAVAAGEAEAAATSVLLALAKTIVIAIVIALVFGVALEALMRLRAIPDFLHGVVFLAAAVAALDLSDVLQSESGLLTVTLLGIYLGNRPRLHLEQVAEFSEHLQVLFVGALFIVLAGGVTPGELGDVLPTALIFLAALVLVVRPVSVLVGLWHTKVTRSERTLLAGMAPRGVVAAAVTSIFALGFGQAARALSKRATGATGPNRDALLAQSKDLAGLATQAEKMVPLVFLLIVCTVAIYGIGVNRFAERLGLATANPQGVLFAGVAGWVVDAAVLLREAGVRVLIVARNSATLGPARRAGLATVAANILSEFAVKDLDLAGIGYFIACTPEDEVNATAARQFARVFGGANTYQLHRDADAAGTGDDRKDTAGHLSARYAFRPTVSIEEMTRLAASGMVVTRIDLGKEFTVDDFRARYGEDAVVMFVQRAAVTVEVANLRVRLPQDSGMLIALVPGPSAGDIPTVQDVAHAGGSVGSSLDSRATRESGAPD
jgi:NhaP-type Na+/H+ or K+/H+ antiporter